MKQTFFIFKVVVISWFLFLGWFIYQLAYPPVVFSEVSPLPIVTKRVAVGSSVTFIADYCKYVGTPATVTFSLQRKLTKKQQEHGISDITIALQSVPNSNVPLGCHRIVPSIPIPPDITPGTYRLIKSIHSRINLFRVVELEYPSEWFVVYEK